MTLTLRSKRREPTAKLRRLAGLALLAVAAVLWWALDRLELRPHWLRVEAPQLAIAGQSLPFRVHLTSLAEATRLCADIHGATTRDHSIGYVATGGSKAVGKQGGTFDFEINVPSSPELRFVSGIFFLSPTGDWRDHTRVAETLLIPVSSNPGDKVVRRLKPMGMQSYGSGNTEDSHATAGPRWLTGLMFLIAAVSVWRSVRLDQGNRHWQLLAVALALACLWELFGLERWFTTQARTIARAWDLYYPRAIFQRAVVSLAMVGWILLYLFFLRVSGQRRILAVAVALYVAIALVNLVSWHPIDVIVDMSWHGFTIVQALKLGCAAIILIEVRRAGHVT